MDRRPVTDILADAPGVDALTLRLAELTTEAALLRSQIRVSKRIERERQRLTVLRAGHGAVQEAPRGH
jgi:hypothetical protein